jgi:hypothetical protein
MENDSGDYDGSDKEHYLPDVYRFVCDACPSVYVSTVHQRADDAAHYRASVALPHRAALRRVTRCHAFDCR